LALAAQASDRKCSPRIAALSQYQLVTKITSSSAWIFRHANAQTLFFPTSFSPCSESNRYLFIHVFRVR